MLNVAGDLAGRRALFFDRGRDRPGHLVDLGDGGRDVPDGAYGRIRHRLHVDDLLTDFVGRLRGLVGEALHFGGDHRKSAAGLAGACGLDGGVERQKVGLRGDGLDQVDDDADAGGVIRKALHGGIGSACFIDRLAGDFRRSHHLTADLGDR